MLRSRTTGSHPTGGGNIAPSPHNFTGKYSPKVRGHGGAGSESKGPSVTVLLAVAAILTLLTYLLPGEGETFQHEIQLAEEMAKRAEQEVLDFWHSKKHDAQKIGEHQQVKPPLHQDNHPHFASEEERKAFADAADQRMLAHSSKWVDGEKKLKAKLKVLYQRQQEGKDLGVPVLTRYLGEDIPAWADSSVNLDEWKEKVSAKYAEMRKEEDEWRAMVAKFMEKEVHG